MGNALPYMGTQRTPFFSNQELWWYYSGVWGQLQVSDQDDSLEGSKGLLLLGV